MNYIECTKKYRHKGKQKNLIIIISNHDKTQLYCNDIKGKTLSQTFVSFSELLWLPKFVIDYASLYWNLIMADTIITFGYNKCA